MRSTAKHALSALTALAMAVLLLPGAVDAQEQEGQEAGAQESCTAQVSPAPVQTGQAAVQATAVLSSDIGAIEDFTVPEESGLALASPGDIPKSEMAKEKAKGEEKGQEKAREESPPRPVELTRGEQPTAILWLNTREAAAGTYEVALEGKKGACTGTLEVSEPAPAEEPAEGESGGR